jgi:hypothetical protein
MPSAPRNLLLAALLLIASPALAARKPKAPPLPPLVLPAAAPLIEAVIAGQTVKLTVDLGGDDIVQINPGSPLRAVLDGDTRPDAAEVDRGRYRVAVGQTSLAIPFSRETLMIAGRPVRARVLVPAAPQPGQSASSDGTIGLPLLPHDRVTLELRPAAAGDRRVTLPARIGRSDAWGFDWPLQGGAVLDVELHPLRATSVISAAAAAELAAVGDGKLAGPVQRVPISFGAIRPVRMLELARPVTIANFSLRRAAVRLFDWAGRSELPPDAEADDAALVVGKRGRQGAWRNLKLGRDVLGGCASFSWQRDAGAPGGGRLLLDCPAP